MRTVVYENCDLREPRLIKCFAVCIWVNDVIKGLVDMVVAWLCRIRAINCAPTGACRSDFQIAKGSYFYTYIIALE